MNIEGLVGFKPTDVFFLYVQGGRNNLRRL